MNIENLKSEINKVLNPLTNKTLFDESRIQSVEMKTDKLYVSYDRTGIDPETNKKIQNELTDKLSKLMNEDHIFIMPKSKSSQEVTGDQTPQEPARLQTGHSTVSPQKTLDNVKHVIAVGSGKGGVGKSTVSLNLAFSLINQGFRVGLVDADIYGPSIPRALGKEGAQVFTNKEKKIVPVEANGLKFVSFGLFIKKNDPVIWRGPMLGGVLNQFFFDVEWGELDYLIIDLPPGTGDVQLSMIQKLKVDGAVIVSTPQDLALIDARRAVEMFKKMKLPIVGIVENMSAFICDNCGTEHLIYGESKLKEFASEYSLDLLGNIPLEMDLSLSCESGQPYMTQGSKFKDSKVWNSYSTISKNVNNILER